MYKSDRHFVVWFYSEIVKKLSPTITTLQELLDNHSIGYLTTIVQDDARKDLSRADREHMVKYFSACEMYNSHTTKFHQTNPELIMHNALRKEYEEIIATVIQVISPESVGNLEQLIACFDPMLSIRTVLSNLASILHFLIFHGISEVIWDPTIHFPSIACKFVLL